MSQKVNYEEIDLNETGLLGNLQIILGHFDFTILVGSEKKPFTPTQPKFYCLITDDKVEPSQSIYNKFCKYDVISRTIRPSLVDKLNYPKIYKNILKEHLIIPDNSSILNDKIKKCLVLSLKKVEKYCLNTKGEEYLYYDIEEKEKLIDYLESHSLNLLDMLYLYVYLSVHKKNSPNFYFGAKYDDDMQEFNEEVICKYGTTTKVGIRAIMNLAKKSEPNMFALYEYAELLYWGRNTISQNIPEAFIWYFKASGFNLPTNDDLQNDLYEYFLDGKFKKIEKEYCNPLALWSIAYIIYFYHRRADLKDCETIDFIERLTEKRRIRLSLYYAYKSYFLNKNGSAANLIGDILYHLSEEELTSYRKLLKEEDQIELLEDPIEYYKLAMADDYIFAFNNYALYLSEKIAKSINENERSKLIDDYLVTLNQSADKGDPWALNSLGLYYSEGRIQKYNDITFIIDDVKAKEYFKRATTTYVDNNTIWACTNLLIKYQKDYDSKNKIDTTKTSFEKLCDLIFQFENTDAIKRLILFFNNEYDEKCHYSPSNISYFHKCAQNYLLKKQADIQTEYIKELSDFCAKEVKN